MGHFNLFLFTLLAVSAILPSVLALPSCYTNRTADGPHRPSSSYSLPPTRTNAPPISKPVDTTTPLPSTSSNPGGGSTSSSDIQTFLDAHNTVRAQHGASPLVWSDLLASKAQQWAANCQFVHSGGKLGQFGENLAAGAGGGYNIVAAVKSWTDEVSDYNPNNPVPSHFTQVVWKSTTQLGCAVQICDNIFDKTRFGLTTFVVCEYSPPGNVLGQFSQNVQA